MRLGLGEETSSLGYTVPNRISISLYLGIHSMYEYSNTRTVVSYVLIYYLLMLASRDSPRLIRVACPESDQPSTNKVRDQPIRQDGYGFWQDVIYLKPKVEE